MLILVLADSSPDSAWERLQALMARASRRRPRSTRCWPSPASPAACCSPACCWHALLSVPFWHAPALVHWGGQGVAQALFSSTLAVWRCKGAFFVYALAWAALMLLFGIVTALVFGLLGVPQLVGLIGVPAGLVFSAVFYISLLFTFNDSFGGVDDDDASRVVVNLR